MEAMGLSQLERSRVDSEVNSFNKSVLQGRTTGGELNKDDFLKILLSQLQHQDPTKPMEDKEFIAQMAQFSTLEQMTNMSTSFGNMATQMQSAQAISLLGKNVELVSNGQAVAGVVEAVTGGDYPQLMVDGELYDYASVTRVKKSEGEPAL
jgi:flagellar basal-body rod modification protein FlgD